MYTYIQLYIKAVLYCNQISISVSLRISFFKARASGLDKPLAPMKFY